jgi:hypothetical protein
MSRKTEFSSVARSNLTLYLKYIHLFFNEKNEFSKNRLKLICNQLVGGSTPSAGSNLWTSTRLTDNRDPGGVCKGRAGEP